MNDIDKIGKQAAKLLQEDATAKKTTRKANADRVAKMRPLLQQVWDALDRGETVNGCTTKKDWVEENSTVTQRNIEYILAGGNKNRPTKRNVSRVVLKPGTLFEIDGWVFEVPQKTDNTDSLASISTPMEYDKTPGNPRFGQKFTNVTLHGVRLVAEKPVPITHARGNTNRGTMSTGRKTRCQNRFVNRKIKNAIIVKNDEATCPDCRAMLDKKPSTNTLDQMLQERDERMSAFFATLPEDMPVKEKNRLFDAEEKKAKQPAPAPKVKKLSAAEAMVKTHKMQPDGRRTFCGKTPGLTLSKDAPMDDMPTCRGCETGELNATACGMLTDKTEGKKVVLVVEDNCPPEKDYTEDEVKALFEETI